MTSDPEPELAVQGGLSICDQIRIQIRDCIVSGQLVAGEQLPTIRAMAVELAVNPSAVSKAYQELEREGFLTSEDGSGTFIAPGAPAGVLQAQWRARFEQLCQEFLSQAAQFGYSTIDVVKTIQGFTERRIEP
jgi:GntR family transcriptional regulator